MGASHAYLDDLPFLAGADFPFLAGDCEDDFVDFFVALFIESILPQHVTDKRNYRNASAFQTQAHSSTAPRNDE